MNDTIVQTKVVFVRSQTRMVPGFESVILTVTIFSGKKINVVISTSICIRRETELILFETNQIFSFSKCSFNFGIEIC